jgi:ribose transport system substrate-binding protein
MTDLKVALALITQDNDYQQEQAAVAAAAAKRLGVRLQVVYAGNDAIAQTKQILALIHAPEADRPNAILVEPVGTGMIGVATAAADAGIGWIVMNREADYLASLRQKSAAQIGSVVCDNVEVGRIQGRQFAALLPAGGSMLYIEGPATDITKQRRAGLDETLPANIEVQTARGRWTEESGFQVLETRLPRAGHRAPSVGAIGCMNDAMAIGARKAAEALTDPERRAQWLKLPYTGVDGVPATGQAWVQQGLLAATVITPPLTGVALELLTKAIAAGTRVPERTVLKATSYPPLEQIRPAASA